MEKPTLGAAHLKTVILYVKDVPRLADFYAQYFGMQPLPGGTDKWVVMENPAGGCDIALHKASAKQKSGAAMKIVFGVKNIRGFIQAAAQQGLTFGAVHEVVSENGCYEFANAKDPAGNSISISSRGLK